MRRGWGRRALCGLVVWGAACQVEAQGPPAGDAGAAALRRGRELLATKQFGPAKAVFAGMLRTQPDDVQAKLGLGDAELGLREFEAAEMTYRQVTAAQPELWQAHKNLVVVEAALGRWEEFDREREVLRLARLRGAPGISPRESDVIDSFNMRGEHWVVRAYFEPVGRSRTVYNFEEFSAAGKAAAYVSLEDEAAARAALSPEDVRVGPTLGEHGGGGGYALNFYTGTTHGTVMRYGDKVPAYERVRADVLRWIRGRSPGTP